MKKLIWLDDQRNPYSNWIECSPIGKCVDIIWCKSYTEFIRWITDNGLPDAICFDHDLGDEIIGFPSDEKTGYDCAKWLVRYCEDNDLKLPKWNIQSSNPVGKENIKSLLTNFEKYG